MEANFGIAAVSITTVFNALAGDKGAITGEQYTVYTEARDAILADHGITLEDYFTWCEEQE